MIAADKTLCLAHEHDKTPRNPRVPPDYCQRLATCARHQAISRMPFDGSNHVKPRVCLAGQHDAFVAIDGADSEGDEA